MSASRLSRKVLPPKAREAFQTVTGARAKSLSQKASAGVRCAAQQRVRGDAHPEGVLHVAQQVVVGAEWHGPPTQFSADGGRGQGRPEAIQRL